MENLAQKNEARWNILSSRFRNHFVIPPFHHCSLPSFHKGVKNNNFKALRMISVPLSLETSKSSNDDKRHRRSIHSPGHDSLHTRTS